MPDQLLVDILLLDDIVEMFSPPSNDRQERVLKQVRQVLAQLPNTFGGERCSIAGCSMCDTVQADYMLEVE